MLSETDIKQGNERIARFVGWEYQPTTEHPHVFPNGVWVDPEANVGRPSLSFHQSWDWLMLGVRKFDRISQDDPRFDSLPELTRMQYVQWCDAIDDTVIGYDLEAVFYVFSGAVEWWAEQIEKLPKK